MYVTVEATGMDVCLGIVILLYCYSICMRLLIVVVGAAEREKPEQANKNRAETGTTRLLIEKRTRKTHGNNPLF